MENKVKVWLARDKDGKLFAYSEIPNKLIKYWWSSAYFLSIELDSSLFPSVKWEDDEPTEACITLAEPQEQPKQEQPKQNIDWEQRRYEIAKEMLPVIYRQVIEVLKYGQIVEWKEIVDGAVNFADVLINELKNENK